MNDNTLLTERYDNGDYLKNNTDWHVEDSSWKAGQIDRIISHNKLKPKFICEIGCGAGEILHQLSMKPYFNEAFFCGYELSETAFELCKLRETEKIKFFYEDLFSKDLKFDTILCIDVFEHVENYMGFLRKLRNKAEHKVFHIPLDLSVSALLRGTMLKGRETVGHLHYFTPETALATLKDCGYQIVDTMFTPSFSDLPSKSFKEKLARIPRTILYRISPKLMSILVGGASLMVLTK